MSHNKKAVWTTVPGSVVSQPAVRKWPRRRSKVAAAACACYPADSAAFVASERALGKTCPVVALVPELRDGFKYGHKISGEITETHHWAGRGHGGRGPLLLDRRLYIGMSRLGHRHVHSNRAWAIENGFMAPAGQWNVPVPADAEVVRLENGGVRVERNVEKVLYAESVIG
jgi:hypothetical protein